MNKARRKQIEGINGRIAAMLSLAEGIKADVEAVRDDEQDYLDNMPESLAVGDKGGQAELAIAALEQVIDDLESLIGNDFAALLAEAAQ